MTAVELAKIKQLKNALSSLEDILEHYNRSPNLDVRDGAIQRFEYTHELVWKTLKERIEQLGQNPRNNPRDIFRVAADQELIDDPQIWFHFQDNRNVSSHLYNNNEMESVFSDLPSFIAEVGKVITTLEQA